MYLYLCLENIAHIHKTIGTYAIAFNHDLVISLNCDYLKYFLKLFSNNKNPGLNALKKIMEHI